MESLATIRADDHHRRPQSPPPITTSAAKPPVTTSTAKVADLAEDSQEKYDKVMGRLQELKRELIESSVICGSNMVSNTRNDSFSLQDDVLPSKESHNILDPVPVRRKGRPATKRKEGVVEKFEFPRLYGAIHVAKYDAS
ncbi:hypothetical protein RHMOL_Rhmol11G0089600 [Rhododendron molle]|uniref:Uncharacterized protein n=1 Tax=Rhododendron molle TaxID=49168 RepID=A0ACC0LRT2_RHOML|nr:hypothetical protein RHMOL_Rhmol11G0089600 [Rhododendron molle]